MPGRFQSSPAFSTTVLLPDAPPFSLVCGVVSERSMHGSRSDPHLPCYIDPTGGMTVAVDAVNMVNSSADPA